MRLLSLSFVSALAAFGQQASQTSSTIDLNGNRETGPTITTVQTGATTTVTEYHSSVNGGRAPLQSTQEKIVRQDANSRVVERIIRRFDPNGNPGPAERQEIQVTKNADGSESTITNVYREDINGRLSLAERITANGSKSGSSTETNVTVEKPTLNGGVEVVERQVRREADDNGAIRSDAVTYRKDPSGQFVEAVKVVAESRQENGQTVRNETQYERGDSGLQLASQTVSRTRTHSDGTLVQEIDLYRNAPGRVATGSSPKLTERQIIEQRKQNGSVVETLTVQRPSLSDPGRLGAPQQIRERVCSGKCP